MAINEKLFKALESATHYLKEVISTLNVDFKDFEYAVWHLAADLEYALLLFSLLLGEHDASSWRPNSVGNMDLSKTIDSIRDLLDRSIKALAVGNKLDAYKFAYMARHHVFIIQEDISKRKKQEVGKK